MDPNNLTPQNPNISGANDTNRPTDPDFHAEGIEIVTGSGIAEDNEFIKNTIPQPLSPEESLQYDAPPGIVDIDQDAPVSPIKPKGKLSEQLPISPLDKVEQELSRQTPVEPFAKPAQNIYTQIPIPQTQTTQETPETIDAIPGIPKPLNDPSIKPLRTFKSDAEEAVKYQNVSAIDIAIAEQKKHETQTKIEYAKDKTGSPGVFVLTAILIIIVISGGWYYWFTSSQNEVAEVVIPGTTTVITATKDSNVYLESGKNPLTLIADKIKVSDAGLGKIYTVIPTISSTSTVLAPIAQVLSYTNIPDRLSRSLAPQYTVGTYTYDANNPFLVIKNTFFQNAFSGMLEWEKDLRRDFLPFIQITHPDEQANATSTAFTDSIMSNVDVRVLKNTQDKVILAYAFSDKDTIIITTNLTSLKYILERLLTVRTIQ